MRLVASLQRRLKVTPRGHHLAVLNHTGQCAGSPPTQEGAHGQDLPLGRRLLACPGFRSSELLGSVLSPAEGLRATLGPKQG